MLINSTPISSLSYVTENLIILSNVSDSKKHGSFIDMAL
jgi:hypothetical protein